MAEKMTGWKAPLLFCALIAGLTNIAYQFFPASGKPELPEILKTRARMTTIDLDSPENKVWKDALIEAASGFQERSVKDAKLQEALMKAIQAGKLEIACAGAAMLKTEKAREEADDWIMRAALASCESLHFGVCALRGKSSSVSERARLLTERFYQCEGGQKAPRADQ